NAVLREQVGERALERRHAVLVVQEARDVVVVDEVDEDVAGRQSGAARVGGRAEVRVALRVQALDLRRRLVVLEDVVVHLVLLREVHDRVHLLVEGVAADERVVPVEALAEHQEFLLPDERA
ncbi:MAG: hypothetical protein ACK559_26615, partial [bacterium]